MTMLVIFMCVFWLSPLLSGAEVVYWVQRRQSQDIYRFTNSSSSGYIFCPTTNNTYLVDENLCVPEHELFKGNSNTDSKLLSISFIHNLYCCYCTGCSHSVVSNDLEASHLVAVAFINIDMSNISYLLIRDKNIPERFYFNGTNQPVDNCCHIDSLEVYRGREQAIEISHDGFSLTENGIVEVQSCATACMF